MGQGCLRMSCQRVSWKNIDKLYIYIYMCFLVCPMSMYTRPLDKGPHPTEEEGGMNVRIPSVNSPVHVFVSKRWSVEMSKTVRKRPVEHNSATSHHFRALGTPEALATRFSQVLSGRPRCTGLLSEEPLRPSEARSVRPSEEVKVA